ncbi:hypothetical protein [Sediminibacterium ginsengisoli]|uniref:Uncharacterized protein n=1 Tax=Sediminibacterium ginsengisoli TaxID=413434 RepID=A0A1T4MP98_9BACT|nr:hypothetical protein [Sediminibacterium ginsengisoli]SJZ68548.1 hypothetical protein SAMN04488132_103484 [Sediminibacterium ginsengisoli]
MNLKAMMTGIFARGGLNGDGTRTYAGFFDDGNLIVNKGAIGIGTSSPFATLQATGASNLVPFKGNSTNYYGGGKNNSGEYGDAYGNGASYDPGNSNTYGGKTGAYFIGGNGGAYAGGAAGIIAIGGNAGVSGTDAWGGSGIYAKGDSMAMGLRDPFQGISMQET